MGSGRLHRRLHDELRERGRRGADRPAARPRQYRFPVGEGLGDDRPRRRGYDAGKKINGTKRHIAVNTGGLLLAVLVTAASTQDRDAAKPLLWNLRRAFPSIQLAWADGGYAGKLVTWAKTRVAITLEIVKRPDDLHTFKVLPRRWVVERTLSWITHCRRTVRDYERLPARHETYVHWSMIIVMTRRLARGPGQGRLSSQAALSLFFNLPGCDLGVSHAFCRVVPACRGA